MDLNKRSLILLSGPIGSGKSTFGKDFFDQHVVSADTLREVISGDANNQAVSRDAFDILTSIIDAKMRHDFPVIVDNLNHRTSSRKDLYRLADKYGYDKVVILFDHVDLATCQKQNVSRTKVVPADIVAKKYKEFRDNIKFLAEENLKDIIHASDVKEPFTFTGVDSNETHDEIEKCVVIGDVHGCVSELMALVKKIDADGYADYKLVFVGDLTDRGPSNAGVLEYVMYLVESGRAICVRGNHDDKLFRYLKGNSVKLNDALSKTAYQIENHTDKDFKGKVLSFLAKMPLYIELDSGKLVVSHAGIEDSMIGKSEFGAIRTFCLYGKITGKKDADGFPERLDWAAERVVNDKSPLIVYGHHAQMEGPYAINKTVNVDTACCFGKQLTGYVYPEGKYVTVEAFETYAEYKRG